MKNLYLTLAIMFFFSSQSSAQMTLAYTYGSSSSYTSQIVNLSRSGKKIAILRSQNVPNAADTIYFYNLDYSFWKMVPCPAIPGYVGEFGFGPISSSAAYVAYCSETLFNTDTFLEVSVTYNSYPTSGANKLFIINENGTIVDSILNAGSNFEVHSTNTGVFVATLNTGTGTRIYNLPGTIPCDACGGGTTGVLGVSQLEKPKDFPTQPIPNPSSNEVKITFTLPDGINRGELQLFSTTGQKLRTYQVDNRFGYVLLDNSELPSGVYYYNIVVSGAISSTQKMVVVK